MRERKILKNRLFTISEEAFTVIFVNEIVHTLSPIKPIGFTLP